MNTLVTVRNKVNIITAPTAGGKTSILIRDMLEHAKDGEMSLFISPEESEMSLLQRACVLEELDTESIDTLKANVPLSNTHFRSVKPTCQIDDIMMMSIAIEKSRGCKFKRIYVDNIGMFGSDAKDLSKIAKLGTLASLMDVTFIISSQLSMRSPRMCRDESVKAVPKFMRSKTNDMNIGSTYVITPSETSSLAIATRTNGNHEVGILLSENIALDKTTQTVNVRGQLFTRQALETALELLKSDV